MKRLSPLALVATVAMLAAACSGRSSSTTSSGSTAASPATTAAAAAGDFGTLRGVCGPGNAAGATDKGVTDTSINVATMSDPGNTVVPGLNQELFDSADAFVGWCNAAGGILGRKLVLHKRDAALFNVAAQMIQSCQAPDFMLVGNGEALDATGVAQRTACGLPEISAYDVSVAAGTAPLSLQPSPTPDNESRTSGALRALAAFDPAAIAHYGMLSSSQQSIKDAGDRNVATALVLGYKQVWYQEAPLAVSNWRPYAQNVQSNGVQVLQDESNPDEFAALLKGMSDVGYFPKYALLDGNMYDPKMITDAGSTLSSMKVYVSTYIVPFELADKNPATKQYIELLSRYANGAKPKSLGVNGFSSWLLFAQAARACGSNLTRQCVMQHASATTDWTAGGLTAPQQPGNATADDIRCFVLVEATPAGWVVDSAITKPNNGIFNCDAANNIALKGFPKHG